MTTLQFYTNRFSKVLSITKVLRNKPYNECNYLEKAKKAQIDQVMILIGNAMNRQLAKNN